MTRSRAGIQLPSGSGCSTIRAGMRRGEAQTNLLLFERRLEQEPKPGTSIVVPSAGSGIALTSLNKVKSIEMRQSTVPDLNASKKLWGAGGPNMYKPGLRRTNATDLSSGNRSRPFKPQVETAGRAIVTVILPMSR